MPRLIRTARTEIAPADHDAADLADWMHGHAEVTFAPGEHTVDGVVPIHGVKYIRGWGAKITKSTPGDCFWLNRDGANTRVFIDGLSLKGKGLAGHGIRIGNNDTSPFSASVFTRSVTVEGFAVNLDLIAAQICKFSVSFFDKGTRGIQALANRASTLCTFDHCTAHLNNGDGVYIEHLVGSEFKDFRAEGNGGWGMHIHQPGTPKNRNIRVAGGWFEANSSGHVKVSNTTNKNQNIVIRDTHVVNGNIVLDANEDQINTAGAHLIGTSQVTSP